MPSKQSYENLGKIKIITKEEEKHLIVEEPLYLEVKLYVYESSLFEKVMTFLDSKFILGLIGLATYLLIYLINNQ